LDDELGSEAEPLEFAARVPAARVAAAALAGLVRLQLLDELALLLCLQARGVADRTQLAVLVVEAEDQRTDGPLLLPGTPPADIAADRPHPLHLHHALALARLVARIELLRDHALAGVEPRLRLLGRVGQRRQLDRALALLSDELLERGAPLRERLRDQLRAIAGEEVEGAKMRRRLLRQHLHPRLGGVEPVLKQVELLVPVRVEDQ